MRGCSRDIKRGLVIPCLHHNGTQLENNCSEVEQTARQHRESETKLSGFLENWGQWWGQTTLWGKVPKIPIEVIQRQPSAKGEMCFMPAVNEGRHWKGWKTVKEGHAQVTGVQGEFEKRKKNINNQESEWWAISGRQSMPTGNTQSISWGRWSPANIAQKGRHSEVCQILALGALKKWKALYMEKLPTPGTMR